MNHVFCMLEKEGCEAYALPGQRICEANAPVKVGQWKRLVGVGLWQKTLGIREGRA